MANPIDKTSKVPLYLQLKEILTEEIRMMKPDDMIAPESALIEKYGVSRSTVRQAISDLIGMHYLYTVRGKGTFVANRNSGFSYMNRVESFREQVLKNKMVPETQVLQKSIILADDETAKGLHIVPGQGILYLKRLQFADGTPLAVSESFLPLPQCASLAEADLVNRSLFEYMDTELHLKVEHVHRIISAVLAESEMAGLLQIAQGTPLLYFTNQSCTGDGTVVEFSHSHFRIDVIPFTADM